MTRELARVMARDRTRLLAALTARFGDLQLAEDALQEAATAAVIHWARNGLPAVPLGWLLRVAARKALDQLRSSARGARRAAALAELAVYDVELTEEAIPDERLRLIFACCHPALEEKSRVALTLRTVCGLSTEEIARAFLDAPATLGQRLSRAKAKIAAAGIPFAVPDTEDWDARLDAVLTTIYLIFTTGYTADPADPRDLCHEAIFLARLLDGLRPAQAETEGALALMLLTEARRAARIGPDGATVPPGEQDRSRWHPERLAEGRRLLETALGRRHAGPFQLKAAISACQMAEPAPDWPQILQIYTLLLLHEPTPVVRLNHAVALAENGLLAAALAGLEPLRPALTDYPPFHAAEAAIRRRAGQQARAAAAHARAIALSRSEADRRLLRKQHLLQNQPPE